MKRVWVFVAILCMACSNSVKKEELQQISGYWEIERVQFPDGKIKSYTINRMIDYIQLETDTSGFRKKLQPRLDGTFIATDRTDRFGIKMGNTNLEIHYTTPFDEWRETIISIKKDELVIKNENNLMYFYKRFQPIIIGK